MAVLVKEKKRYDMECEACWSVLNYGAEDMQFQSAKEAFVETVSLEAWRSPFLPLDGHISQSEQWERILNRAKHYYEIEWNYPSEWDGPESNLSVLDQAIHSAFTYWCKTTAKFTEIRRAWKGLAVVECPSCGFLIGFKDGEKLLCALWNLTKSLAPKGQEETAAPLASPPEATTTEAAPEPCESTDVPVADASEKVVETEQKPSNKYKWEPGSKTTCACCKVEDVDWLSKKGTLGLDLCRVCEKALLEAHVLDSPIREAYLANKTLRFNRLWSDISIRLLDGPGPSGWCNLCHRRHISGGQIWERFAVEVMPRDVGGGPFLSEGFQDVLKVCWDCHEVLWHKAHGPASADAANSCAMTVVEAAKPDVEAPIAEAVSEPVADASEKVVETEQKPSNKTTCACCKVEDVDWVSKKGILGLDLCRVCEKALLEVHVLDSPTREAYRANKTLRFNRLWSDISIRLLDGPGPQGLCNLCHQAVPGGRIRERIAVDVVMTRDVGGGPFSSEGFQDVLTVCWDCHCVLWGKANGPVSADTANSCAMTVVEAAKPDVEAPMAEAASEPVVEPSVDVDPVIEDDVKSPTREATKECLFCMCDISDESKRGTTGYDLCVSCEDLFVKVHISGSAHRRIYRDFRPIQYMSGETVIEIWRKTPTALPERQGVPVCNFCKKSANDQALMDYLRVTNREASKIHKDLSICAYCQFAFEMIARRSKESLPLIPTNPPVEPVVEPEADVKQVDVKPAISFSAGPCACCFKHGQVQDLHPVDSEKVAYLCLSCHAALKECFHGSTYAKAEFHYREDQCPIIFGRSRSEWSNNNHCGLCNEYDQHIFGPMAHKDAHNKIAKFNICFDCRNAAYEPNETHAEPNDMADAPRKAPVVNGGYGMPPGFSPIKLKAYSDGKELIICGDPGDGEGDESVHNCDEMGCGTDHVLYRLPLAPTK